jgi:hypothetical protein
MMKTFTRQQLETYLRSSFKEISPEAISFLENVNPLSQGKCVKVWHDWLKLEQEGNDIQISQFKFELSSFESNFLWIARNSEEQTQSLVSVDDEPEQRLSLADVEQQLRESGL